MRPVAEILATLDERGTLEGLPFMPGMRKYCGHHFRVRSAPKKLRFEDDHAQLIQNVFLLDGLRCNGEGRDNCQRRCPIFWHEAWLRPVAGETNAAPDNASPAHAADFPEPTGTGGNGRFCQFEWLRSTRPLSKKNL